MAERMATHGFDRRMFLAGAAGIAVGSAFGTPVMAQGAQTLRIRFGSDISQLDPAKIFGIENQSIATHIYSGLVKYDQATNAIVPDIATGHEVSSDGTVWTFRLRPGVTWHKNYGAFTSDDVKFSFDRILDAATGSAYRGQLAELRLPAQAVRLQPGLDRLAARGHRDRRALQHESDRHGAVRLRALGHRQ
jgi:peptide/nickel transport system substrate-binding protein